MSTKSELENILEKRWQLLKLSEKSEDLSSSERADIHRNLMVQIQFAIASKIVDHRAGCKLYLEEGKKYSSVMDQPEEQGGVNNFAEGAMSLLEGKNNDSKEWRSGLKTSMSNMECVKKFIETSKIERASMVPDDMANVPLNIKTHSRVTVLSTKSTKQPQPKLSSSNFSDKRSSSTDQPFSFLSKSSLPQSSTSNNNLDKAGSSNTAAFWNEGSACREVPVVPKNQQTVRPLFKTTGSSDITSRTHDGNISTSMYDKDNGQPEDVYKAYCRYRDSSQPRPEKRQRPSSGNDEDMEQPTVSDFKTAKEQLVIDQHRKNNRNTGESSAGYGSNKRSLGTRRGLNTKFVPPVMSRDDDYRDDGGSLVRQVTSKVTRGGEPISEEPVDERLKNIDPKIVDLIMSEIMDHGPPVGWDDIAGLEFAKKTIKEIVVWPMLRPDIFQGLRGPPKGLLLFGPPGTGKTLIGKCIASQSKSTFFSISASSLTSKWVGEGEKMVRGLFAVARVQQPSVIFIDEIDSLLSQRGESEHESSRRIKTEFLVQLDGATTGADDRILVVGATNRPQEIDEAARRRFVKRLYIPLPETAARRQIVVNLLAQQTHGLNDQMLDEICQESDGYSGADMSNLCREAALGPIRIISFDDIQNISLDQVQPITHKDFVDAFGQVRASVSVKDLDLYIDWNKQYGSWKIQ